MKNTLLKISALLLAVLFAFGGCSKPAVEEPIDVTAPVETPAAVPEQIPEEIVETDEGYSIISEEILLPQDVPEEEAVYRLSYQVPEFEEASANDAVLFYLDELYTRVTSERMPYADPVDSLPYTEVTFEIQHAALPAGEYTNVVFTEKHSFSDEEGAEYDRHVVVIAPDGSECCLASVSGVYFPEGMAAQQVLNVIAYEPDNYYGDLTTDSILSVLDLYNGFAVADEGYTLFLPAGTIAAEEKGMMEISFPRRALYPGFVGDVMAEEDYEKLMPVLSAAAAVWGPEFSGFSGAPSEEFAHAFMNKYLLSKGYASASAGDYAAEYAAIFGGEITAPSDPVTVIPDEMPVYGVQWEDAHGDGDTLTLSGQLMSGAPGSSSAAPAASVTATLAKGAKGWMLTGFEVM